MEELYRQLWRLVLAFAAALGGLSALWLALELAAEWALERAQGAKARRLRSYRRVAARHGRVVRER